MKYILVTGAASGIGKKITETLSRRDWIVFAADINKNIINSYNHKNIIPIYIDIVNEKSVENAYREIAKNTLYLDVIINCAGVNMISPLIENGLNKTENVINVNLLGMIRVNKIIFPLLDKEKGRIININSELGNLSPAPFEGSYAISAHAIDAYSDCLRRELSCIGIKVIKINLGPFKTPMNKKVLESYKNMVETTRYFEPELKGMYKILRSNLKYQNDPDVIMKTIIKACENKKPKICYKVRNNFFKKLLNLLPSKILDIIYKNMLEK